MASTIFKLNSPHVLFIASPSTSSTYYHDHLKYLTYPILVSTMKFEDYLMQQSSEDNQKRQDLEYEVKNLESVLEDEQAINKVLHSAVNGFVPSHPCLSTFLPPQIQGLLAELAMVEEEITWLERKVDEMKLSLYQERKKRWKLQKKQQRIPRLLPPTSFRPGNGSVFDEDSHQLSKSQRFQDMTKDKIKFRRASVSSAEEMSYLLFSPGSASDDKSIRGSAQSDDIIYKEIRGEKENLNELSEEIIKCLIGIFLDINQAPQEDREKSALVPKLNISCISTKGSKTQVNSKAPMLISNNNASNLDPYGILLDFDSTRDIGPYKHLIQITENSIDLSHISSLTGTLRVLMHKLGNVKLRFLSYKQKLAFWINIYNASIMHAYLEYGLPSSPEKLLMVMNKATVNVGGIVLNALAIEHFILRHPRETKHGPPDEEEMLLRHAYGLGYPEPNVTFALCRGTWSSPALRVYTTDVVNELERAKTEYLEASVGITSKKKIVVPKLLQWHMQDFADGMGSLLEWIYSQLPHSGSLKLLMMECLIGQTKYPPTKMVEIHPYESEFRYLLPF